MINYKSTNIWIIPFDFPEFEISEEEENIAKSLVSEKSIQFRKSRGYARKLIADIFNIDPQKVPLRAEPGKVPTLEKGFGFISLSHCIDRVMIAWSINRIGVDIERKNRIINAKGITKRFYNEKDKKFLNNFSDEQYNFEVLKTWVIKESLIKWQRGSISNDLKKWKINSKLKNANHPFLKETVNFFSDSNKEWIISIASNSKLVKNGTFSIKFI